MSPSGADLPDVASDLSDACERLSFAAPVAFVYNPLVYARDAHRRYLEVAARETVPVVLLGMNPGPFGMAQTGVPFGDVGLVRDWLGIDVPVGRPPAEHPKRPVLGFDCPRGEVSGRRLWGWAREAFGDPARFFDSFFVWNYCPLAFMEAGGRNRTPDKLPRDERDPLHAVCDEALRAVVARLRPGRVVGIGRFAADRARRALGEAGPAVGVAPHPSPASPLANRGWPGIFESALAGQGIEVAPGSR